MSAAQQKWIADYQSAHPGVTINYSPDGSGAGREAFTSGAVQYAGSDRPFKDEEMGAGKFAKCTAESNALNLPVYVSPIAVIFNVQGVDSLKLDPDTVAGIFAGTITKWNDAKIAATNPDAKLPDAAITAVHRSDDSGTTNNFTDYLNQAAPSVWTEAASDTFPAAFGGESAKGTSAVVDAVTSGKNTIGYADASAAGQLGHAQLKVGNAWLSPTAEAAAKIVDASKQVATLGAFALPIEVIPMARELVASRARALGGEPVLRAGFITDNGNQILDVFPVDDVVGKEAIGRHHRFRHHRLGIGDRGPGNLGLRALAGVHRAIAVAVQSSLELVMEDDRVAIGEDRSPARTLFGRLAGVIDDHHRV